MMRDRFCIDCGLSLPTTAPPNRKYCDATCAARNMGNGRSITQTPEADMIATKNLLHALIRLGWKSDGLPGLSAWEFRALAREEGIMSA